MRRECIELLVTGTREIEFTYLNKEYSITYYNDNRKNNISFCEAYQIPTDVPDVNELLKIKLGDKTLEQVFAEIPDSDFDIY